MTRLDRLKCSVMSPQEKQRCMVVVSGYWFLGEGAHLFLMSARVSDLAEWLLVDHSAGHFSRTGQASVGDVSLEQSGRPSASRALSRKSLTKEPFSRSYRPRPRHIGNDIVPKIITSDTVFFRKLQSAFW